MEKPEQIKILSPSNQDDHEWLKELWLREWGGEIMISKGNKHHFQDLESLIAWRNDIRVGAVTYHISDHGCELMSINSILEGLGIGSALLSAAEEKVKQLGIKRVWLITSNDNLDALRFYQRRGYRIIAVYPNAINEARKIKPSIPEVGHFGIPINDEIELEKLL